MAAGAVGQAVGGVVGAASNILGGILGQADTSSGAQIMPFAQEQADFSLQAGRFDAGLGSGFSNINLFDTAGPFQRLIAQIQALPIENKMKRRALEAIETLRERGGDDPNITVQFSRELDQVLRRIGINREELGSIFSQQTKFQSDLSELSGIGTFQPDVIRDRLTASANVANTAAGLSGGESSRLQDLFRQEFLRDSTREFDRQEEALLLRSQFAGVNPGLSLTRLNEQRSDLPFDAEIAALQRALGVASGVNSLLFPATSASLQGGQLSVGASQGAVGIAAGQATAANQVRALVDVNNATSFGNTIVAAGQNLSDGIVGAFAPAATTTPTFDNTSTVIT